MPWQSAASQLEAKLPTDGGKPLSTGAVEWMQSPEVRNLSGWEGKWPVMANCFSELKIGIKLEAPEFVDLQSDLGKSR